MGKLDLVLMGRAMFSQSLIQFSIDGEGRVPSLLFDLRQNFGGSNEDNGDLLQKVPSCTAALGAPNPAAGHCRPTPLPESPGHSPPSLAQSLVGSLLLSPEFWCTQGNLLQQGLGHTQGCCSQSTCPCGRPLLTRTSAGDTQTQL